MSQADAPAAIARTGTPAPIVRLFGWASIAILIAFLINNVLTVGFGFPGTFAQGLFGSPLQLGIYVIAVLAAAAFVFTQSDRSLRFEADQIHRVNVFLIRWAFWSVFLCGLVDTFIALGRVEAWFDGDFASNALRSAWVGVYIHLPLIALSFVISFFTRTLGFHWLALLIVVAELAIVISRFVFSYEQALMADLVRYWYAALFLFASAYTLYDDGHVRVDVLYAGFGRTRKGFFNAWGTLLLGMTTAWIVLVIGLNGKQSIINSPVMNFEVTQSGSTGMYIKYQMAAFLGIFALTMLIQFVSYFFESIADYRDEPGAREVAASSAH